MTLKKRIISNGITKETILALFNLKKKYKIVNACNSSPNLSIFYHRYNHKRKLKLV